MSTVLTSASVHDSQVAIPLMKMSVERVGYLIPVNTGSSPGQAPESRGFVIV